VASKKQKARVIFMDEQLLARAEKLLSEMDRDLDAAFAELKGSAGGEVEKRARACRTWREFKENAGGELEKNMLKTGEAYRVRYTFACALAAASGRNIYKPKWDFERRLTDVERRLWLGIRGKAMPPVVLPQRAQKLLAAVKSSIKPSGPRIVAMEDLTAAEQEEIRNPAQTYRSLSRPKIGPSRE
jgi:hypothetical protein